MSKVPMMRAFVRQRLSAAAEEILGLLERTMAEYEEEIERQRRLLQDGGRREVRAGVPVIPANVEMLTVIKEIPPDQHQHSTGVEQEDSKAAQTKEEQEEPCTAEEGEQHEDLGKAHAKFLFMSVPVKMEEDEEEEKPQSLLLLQTVEQEDGQRLKKKATGEEHEGPEPARKRAPDRPSQPATNKISSGTGDSREPQSGFGALKNRDAPVGENRCTAAEQCYSCSECANRFISEVHLQGHGTSHTGEKTSTCPFCGKKFTKNSNLTTHLRVHTGEKPFTCSVCNTSFSLRCTLVNHMRVHTGEKPFSCSVCAKRFSKKANLTTHMALHSAEKPFKCSLCERRFTWHSQIKNHKCAVDHRTRVT
ncbi:hypothetical protein Q5P01_018854 [Channa striata]|uniref:C2H2-type domain-containing protein n=1 Tax=Channa striata TaxID=64152 RepID=A0AA88M8H7_CHASR|nr:hypothetical protein Q5P01_018854 [Channa striata]